MQSRRIKIWRAHIFGLMQTIPPELLRGLGITAIGLFLGVVVALAVPLMFGFVDFLQTLWIPQETSLLGWPGFSLLHFLLPLIGGVSIGVLVYALVPQRPAELADVIAAAHHPDPVISRTGGYISTLKSMIAISAGSATGLYAPLIVMGAAMAANLKKLLRLPTDFAEMALGAGVAAAIAAAFGAPLGGIVFAHEVVLRHYSLRFFAPVTLASATAYLVADHVRPVSMDILPNLQTAPAQFLDIILLIMLGVLCGLLAVAFMHGMRHMRGRVEASGLPIWARPIAAGFFIALLAHIAPGVLGIGTGVMADMLSGQMDSAVLLGLVVLKMIAACVCLSLFFHGGIMAPALFIGAGFGALFANFLGGVTGVLGYVPDVGLFALAGMAATAGSVMGAPLAMILISFELTQNYDATTAIVISIVLANLVASRLYARSVFEFQLLDKGIDLSLGRESLALQSMPVTELMSVDYLSVPENGSVGYAMARMAEVHCAEAHLVDDEGHWMGKICLYNLINQGLDDPAKAFIEADPLILMVDTNALSAQSLMQDFVGEGVPVLEGEKLVGIVHEADLFRHARMVTRSVWAHDHDEKYENS